MGNLDISATDGALTLQLGPAKQAFALTHWDRDTFLYEPDAELPGVVSGARFGIGADQTAQQVVLENVNDVGQGVLTWVAAKP